MSNNITYFPSLKWIDNSGCIQSNSVEDYVFIGRSCKGVPTEKQILIQDQNVSRVHAVVTFTGKELLLRDCSRNGTRVNGIRLKPGFEFTLKNSDIIKVDDYEFKVLNNKFNKKVDDGIVDHKMSDTTRVASEIVYVTNLVADARGYSSISQQFSPLVISSYMKEIFSLLSKIVYKYQGSIQDFAGDSLYAYWEHGKTVDTEKVVKACNVALEQEQAILELSGTFSKESASLKNLKFGWGITTGKVSISYYGIQNDNLAIVGDCTNLAFRLSSDANKKFTFPIIMCKNTASFLGKRFNLQYLGKFKTKGRIGEECVYGLSL